MKYTVMLLSLWCATAAYAEPAMFRGDAKHSGIYPGPGVAVLHGLAWKFKTDGPVLSSPVVADGTVYFGSNDHSVYAVNAADGVKRWQFKTGSRVSSSPAVDSGLVYVGSYDGVLYALDAGTGKERWRFHFGGEHRFIGRHLHGSLPAAEAMPDPFDLFLSSPTVAKGVIYVGSGDGFVYALDAAAGTLRWKFKTGNVVHASPTVADGVVYVGSWDSFFYALDAETGRERWRFKTGTDEKISNQVGIQSSAIVSGGRVYFGCRDANLYALDAATGAKLWAFANAGSWVVSTPIVSGGVLYFATSDSGLFRALNASTGAPIYSISFHHWPMFSSPAIADRMLYLGSHAGTLLAIDLEKRSVAWTFETDGAVRNGPALTQKDGEPNYAAAFADDFYDDLVIGAWRMMSIGAVVSSPFVADGRIYFGSTDGNVYAVH